MIMPKTLLLLFLTYCITLINSAGRGEDGNAFVKLYDCNCLGYTQSFECTACGSGVTVWRGTAFDCQPNEIRLRHSQYTNAQVTGECNGGAILAKSVGVEAGCYTSMLNVTIEQDMINKTIECVYDDLQTNNTIMTIGCNVLTIVQEPSASPNEIYFKATDMNRSLEFSWSAVIIECPQQYVQYIVDSTNCGLCPNNTFNTAVLCLNSNAATIAENQACIFSVQAEICGNILSEKSKIYLNALNLSIFNSEGSVSYSTTMATYTEDIKVYSVSSTVVIATALVLSSAVVGVLFIITLALVISKRKLHASKQQNLATSMSSDQNVNNEPVTNEEINIESVYSLLQRHPLPIEMSGTKAEDEVVYAEVGECFDHCQREHTYNLNITCSHWDKVEYAEIIQQPKLIPPDTEVHSSLDSETHSKTFVEEARNTDGSDSSEQPPPIPPKLHS